MTVAGTSPWLPGDRLPDVVLRELDSGETQRLHARFAGTPLLLAVPAAAPVPGGVDAPPADRVALWLVSDDVTAHASGRGWRTMRVDPGWLRQLRGTRCGQSVAWFVDSNLRLVHCAALSSLGIQTPQPLPDIEPMPMPMPVLVIPGVLEAELCLQAIRHFEQDCGGGEPSGVLVYDSGRVDFALDPSIKQRRETFVRDTGLETRMHERLLRRALPEINRVFQFQVTRRDPLKLLAYRAGAGYFNAHRDNDTPDVAHRRFALSVNLNADDYRGGAFGFPEFGPTQVAPPTGAALVFSCSLLHAVTPVESGCRYAMTTFLA